METEKNYTLEDVIEKMFDFTDYSDEEKNEVIAETVGMITESALLRGLDAAGEPVQNAFNTLIESEPDAETVESFIKINIPNFQALIEEEVKVFAEMGEEEIKEGE